MCEKASKASEIINMTSVFVVAEEHLEQEYSPGKTFEMTCKEIEVFLIKSLQLDEIEESEYVECTQVETVNSPFAYLLANMLQGGGRNRRDMVSRERCRFINHFLFLRKNFNL